MDKFLNQIICGDNVEVMRQMPDKCVDLTVTSPPYDNLRTYNGFSNTYYKNKNVRIYQCDNLNLLKQLPDNYIDLIYCDILYGTGRNFGDYQDLKADRKVIEEHYIPRLIEMKRILKTTGSIYLQCDYRINHWIRCIMDDIFGYGNFRNEIIWCYKNGGASKSNFSNKHDDIYWYSKSKKYKYNLIKEKSYLAHRYGFKGIEEFKDEKGWYTMVNPKDYWNINPVTKDGNEKTEYSTQKPKALLERIIKASSNEGDIVADFYMGSGTTGEVALELGRKFIGCDISERACEITKARLEHWQMEEPQEDEQQQTLFGGDDY